MHVLYMLSNHELGFDTQGAKTELLRTQEHTPPVQMEKSGNLMFWKTAVDLKTELFLIVKCSVPNVGRRPLFTSRCKVNKQMYVVFFLLIGCFASDYIAKTVLDECQYLTLTATHESESALM